MVVYPEEIVEMANLLMKDIADSKDDIESHNIWIWFFCSKGYGWCHVSACHQYSYLSYRTLFCPRV